MLYYLTRPLARIALKVFFKKIHIANAERIPPDKPVILAANHPAAFMEPCLLAVLVPRTLFFLTKGNIFKGPLLTSILKSYHMWPLYSREDGLNNLKKNSITLDHCYQMLAAGKTILIMAEGSTRHEKRLRPIQKGPARVAFGAIKEKGELDIYLVPVGVNYTYADRFRSEVMFDISPPIRILDYLHLYQEKPALAIKKVTEQLAKSLKKSVIAIEDEEDTELVEQLFLMWRNGLRYSIFPILVTDREKLTHEKRIADRVNAMDLPQKQQWKDKLLIYQQLLRDLNVSDWALVQKGNDQPWGTIFLILGFLPFLGGLLLNYPPAWLAKLAANTVAKRREFYSSVMVSVGLFAFIFYYLVWLSAAYFVGRLSFWIFVLIIPLLGFFALIYREFYEKYQARRQLRRDLDPYLITKLKEKRKEFDFFFH